MDPSEKADNLRAVYTALHSYAQLLRDRIMKVVTGTIGIAVVADGWIIAIAAEKDVPWNVRSAIVFGIFAVSVVGGFGVVTHYREYLGTLSMIVRVEEAMKLYEEGKYLASGSLFAASFKLWGTGKHSSHIRNAAIASILVFLVCSIILVTLI